MTETDRTRSSDRRGFAWIGVITLTVVILLFLWYTAHVLLLAFAGVLLGILLHASGAWVSAHTPLSQRWGLGLVLLAIAAVTILVALLLAPEIGNQLNKLFEELPRAVEKVWDQIRRHGWGQEVTKQIPGPEDLAGGLGGLLGRAAGFLSTTFGAVAGLFIILFLGLYFAFEPELYIEGLARLAPLEKRRRTLEIVQTLGFTLRWWLIGRLMDMTLVGVLSGVGLWLLGIPLALSLGILAGLLNFIPNIGPLLAAVPAVLLALTEGAPQALYVVILYVGIQSVESYLVVPLIQKKLISMPPVLIFIAQLSMALIFGVLGLLLATPIAAVLLVLVKMIYIEDILGEEIDVDGEPKA